MNTLRFAAALAACLLVACGTDPAFLGNECVSDSDCESNICIAGICADEIIELDGQGGPGDGVDAGIADAGEELDAEADASTCLLYTSPSPRDRTRSRMPSSA